MKERTYYIITNTCIVVAVMSAVVFDKVPTLRIVCTITALLATIVSMCTYFYNQRNS